MKLREIIAMISNPRNLKETGRITRKSLMEGDVPVLVSVNTSSGLIAAYADGTVLFEDGARYTVFSISDCENHQYTSLEYGTGITVEDIPYSNPVYDWDLMKEMEWYIAVLFVGQDRIDENRGKRHKHISIEALSHNNSSDAEDVPKKHPKITQVRNATPDFSEVSDMRVDFETITAVLTEDQRTVIHKRYGEEKSYQKIGEECGGDKATARQRAKRMHDRGISNIIRRGGASLQDYKDV